MDLVVWWWELLLIDGFCEADLWEEEEEEKKKKRKEKTKRREDEVEDEAVRGLPKWQYRGGQHGAASGIAIRDDTADNKK